MDDAIMSKKRKQYSMCPVNTSSLPPSESSSWCPPIVKLTPVMDSLTSQLQVPKTRRKYSHAFKAMVVKACSELGNSTIGYSQADIEKPVHKGR